MQSSRLNILRCKNKLPIFRQGPSPCLSRRATFHNLTWPQTTSLAHFSSLKPKSKHGLPGSSLNWRHMSTSSGPRPPRFVNARDIYKQRNRTLMMYTSAVIVLAVGVTYAAVPLYRMFCAATGFAGTPVVGTGKFEPERLVPVDNAKRIKVHFNANRSEQLPWKFTPQQKYVSVLPGETSLAFYKARNESKEDVIGIATYNVTPDRIAPYFAKVECFCFEEQKLLAGEEVDMPLLFFIDKDVLDDPACRNLDDVVLSYTFFRARRNSRGHLEPDAPEDVVQASQGFGDYEHAPKAEDRADEKNRSS